MQPFQTAAYPTVHLPPHTYEVVFSQALLTACVSLQIVLYLYAVYVFHIKNNSLTRDLLYLASLCLLCLQAASTL